MVAHLGSVFANTLLAGWVLSLLLLLVIHAVAGHGALVSIRQLAAISALAALGAGCAAAAGAAVAFALRSKVGGVLVMAGAFFILPAVAAALGIPAQLLPVAQRASLVTLPVERQWADVLVAFSWPVLLGAIALWRTCARDLDS